MKTAWVLLALLAPAVTVGAEPAPAQVGEGGDAPASPARLYAEFCAACHGSDHVSLSDGLYPALFGNPRIAAAGAVYVALKALRGNGSMYPLCAFADDTEITAIANYLAAANAYQGVPLGVEAVAPLRPAAEDCPVAH